MQQDAGKVGIALQQMDQRVIPGLTQYQNAAHALLLQQSKKTKESRAAVWLEQGVLVWNGSGAADFVVRVHALKQKASHARALFVPAAGAAGKLNVEIELGPNGALFGKQPLQVKLRCSYSAPVSPMVMVLGAVLLSFGREKDLKAKKPAPLSSYFVLLCRSVVNTTSRSFLSLQSAAPLLVVPSSSSDGHTTPTASASSLSLSQSGSNLLGGGNSPRSSGSVSPRVGGLTTTAVPSQGPFFSFLFLF